MTNTMKRFLKELALNAPESFHELKECDACEGLLVPWEDAPIWGVWNDECPPGREIICDDCKRIFLP